MEMESEDKDVRIEIPGTLPTNKNNAMVEEWEFCIKGHKTTKRYERKRHIGKVPPLLLKGEKGHRNSECYVPAVISLGPYHHNRTDLAEAEKYKLITLEEFQLSSGKPMSLLYNKVFEVVHDARKCYIDGSTENYNDVEFSRMMTRDGCFILFFIECISCGISKVMLNNEFLGALGFGNLIRDIFMLENQIPFAVLKVLLDLRFPKDKGEEILNKFFNYLNFGEVMMREFEKVLENKQPAPLHLLELYRSYFISLSASLFLGSTRSFKWHKWAKETDVREDFNYVKRNRSFASVMELKSKGIFVKPSYDEYSNEDIKFHSHGFYGELKLVCRAVTSITKVLCLNMIAYEMCPHNPNDFRVSTYIRVMKTLVVHPDDVRELRNSNVLLHSLGGDEEVVKMYADIQVPDVKPYMFNQLRKGIEKHYNSKYKIGVAEVIHVYCGSPWKTIASLAAVSMLLVTCLQTYFTLNPLPKASN